jgi:photosystem I reaction center subunit XII
MNLSDGQVFTALLVSLLPAVMAALLGSALSDS